MGFGGWTEQRNRQNQARLSRPKQTKRTRYALMRQMSEPNGEGVALYIYIYIYIERVLILRG